MAVSAHRKVVAVLFCDVVGSTALGESVDPEALQGLLARYFERMKGIVESHGGSVEKFIGDAVMAVFGVPVVHEDDALRACRAAVEMREALPGLGLEGRIGVNTGEVLAGTEERLATGDAVNVAARLEQAANPGEVLVGVATFALVGGAVDVGEERMLELKGKRTGRPVAPLSNMVWVGVSAGSLVMGSQVGQGFVSGSPVTTGDDRVLGLVDFAMFPHLNHEAMPDHSMAAAEVWAAGLPVPAYAIDDETAIKVVGRTIRSRLRG